MTMKVDSYPRTAQEKASFPYVLEISKPFGKLDDIISWCKSELQDEWRWSLIQPSSDVAPGRYQFFLSSERDACAFTLQWC